MRFWKLRKNQIIKYHKLSTYNEMLLMSQKEEFKSLYETCP